mmetsp:Transcript_25808/g.72263  ORF Transcript_25808/g.72263 Transcript_25808/m.72263 type:complete len:281 (+) Transcript_25808:1370-2212(+)
MPALKWTPGLPPALRQGSSGLGPPPRLSRCRRAVAAASEAGPPPPRRAGGSPNPPTCACRLSSLCVACSPGCLAAGEEGSPSSESEGTLRNQRFISGERPLARLGVLYFSSCSSSCGSSLWHLVDSSLAASSCSPCSCSLMVSCPTSSWRAMIFFSRSAMDCESCFTWDSLSISSSSKSSFRSSSSSTLDTMACAEVNSSSLRRRSSSLRAALISDSCRRLQTARRSIICSANSPAEAAALHAAACAIASLECSSSSCPLHITTSSAILESSASLPSLSP